MVMRAKATVDNRFTWTDESNRRLDSLWHAGAPINVIALLLDKTPSLVQTRASRAGLPVRPIPEFAKRHRARWTDEDVAALGALAVINERGPNFRETEAFARRVERTIDAIVARLFEGYGQQRLGRLVDDYRSGNTLSSSLVERLKAAGLKLDADGNNKTCNRCRRRFISPDVKRIWRCGGCKRDLEGMTDSDTDADFFCDAGIFD